MVLELLLDVLVMLLGFLDLPWSSCTVGSNSFVFTVFRCFFNENPCVFYAHIEVLVTSLLVKHFSFLVIARNRSDVYGRNLVEIDPTSLPQLSI